MRVASLGLKSPANRPPRSEIDEHMTHGKDDQSWALIIVVLVLDTPVLWKIGFFDGVNLVEGVRLGRFRVGPCGS